MALPWLITGDISWVLELKGMICVIVLSVFTTILPFSLFTKGIEKITLGKAYTLSLFGTYDRMAALCAVPRGTPLPYWICWSIDPFQRNNYLACDNSK